MSHSHPIYVNGRFTKQPITGVQRYAWEISRRLEGRIQCVVPKFAAGKGMGHLWEQFVLPFAAPKGSLMWSPCGSGPVLLPGQVITIHDIAHYMHPEWYHPLFAAWHRWLLPRLVRKASQIITVSKFSREQIIANLQVAPDRIRVIPLGVDEKFFMPDERSVDQVIEKYGIAQPYILAVSSVVPRKNLEGTLKAWQSVCSVLPGVSMVIAGKRDLHFSGKTKLQSLPNRTVFTGYVAEEDLPALYRGAAAFVYPSFYEGFGLPILEAMAAGTPVITSNVTSMPEVAGKAALLIDPYDTKAIADAILRLMRDENLRMKLSEKGRNHARLYNWDRTASLTWEVLWETAGGREWFGENTCPAGE